MRDRRRQFRELVKERNLLVHGLLADFDPDSVESGEKLIRLLKVAQQEILKQLEAELRQSVLFLCQSEESAVNRCITILPTLSA